MKNIFSVYSVEPLHSIQVMDYIVRNNDAKVIASNTDALCNDEIMVAITYSTNSSKEEFFKLLENQLKDKTVITVLVETSWFE